MLRPLIIAIPSDERALHVQMKELTQQVESLKVQQISANQEMKLQRSWMERDQS